MEDNLTEAEREQLKEYLGYGAAGASEKQNAHTFLFNVAKAKDTTKLGNLSPEEVGVPRHSIRTYQNISLIAKNVIGSDNLAKHFSARSEVVTSTSLSKNAKLINLAVIQRRQVEDLTKPERKPSSSWFKPKKKDNDEGEVN